MFILAIAFAIILPNLASWLDNRVSTAVITGENDQIEAFNVYGRRIAHFKIPQTHYPKPVIEDIESDGEPEIFIGTSVHDSIPGILICYNGDGSERWRFEGGIRDDSPSLYASFENTFSCNTVHVRDLDGDSENEVISVFNHTPHYPAQIAVLTEEGDHKASFLESGKTFRSLVLLTE